MDEIRRFRNRLAHHDCLLRQPVASVAAKLLDIAGWIDPDAKTWMQGQVDVTALLAQKP
jgi:hypothetical protein